MGKIDRYLGRNVYISGGSSGIGLSCAKLFAGLGANVFIFARRPEVLQQASAQIESRRASPGQRLAWKSIDVTDHVAVSSGLADAIREFGHPHIVITSAGIAYPEYFERIPYEMFDLSVKTNLYGIWNVLAALVPSMKTTGGHIVNVSSIAGIMGVFGYTAYCSTKFAVIGMSESLRSEVKPYGIRVSVLCPPDTDTPGLAREDLTKPAETRALAGNAGIMNPDDVAGAMLRGMERGRFLIIPGMEARFISLAKRLVPSLAGLVMDSIVAKVRRSAEDQPG